jgi:hypothetical protein
MTPENRSTPHVELTHDVQHDPLSALFMRRVIERELRELRADSWTTAASSLRGLGEPLHRWHGPGGETVIVERDGLLVQVGVGNGWAHAQLAGDDDAALERALAELKRLLPAPDPDSTHEVPVVFWTYSPHGPQPAPRTIAVPEWADIAANYAKSTRAGLERLMRRFEPAHGGQLVLWHGKAGSGKTFALRALAWEWRTWCELHYIVDPDSFFGEHADYLMNVLMQPSYLDYSVPVLSGGGIAEMGFREELGDGDGRFDDGKAWKLLVLEDTGELLTPDAKSIIGQGLSRFLNVVDGLIGQGLRVLVLVTTNEELRTLHPAVARPGRCAANVEFTPLDVEEASAWLERHDAPAGVERPTLLASLYAAVEGFDEVAERRDAGFAR